MCLTLGVGGLHGSVRPLELGEGSLCGHELLVRAHLCDLSLHHHQHQVHLRQVAQPVGHQHPGLHRDNTRFRTGSQHVALSVQTVET